MTIVEDIHKVREDVERIADIADSNRSAIARHEEQIAGPRGLQASIEDLSAEIKSLRKAAYWVGGVIVAGSITFAFSVLALVGG